MIPFIILLHILILLTDKQTEQIYLAKLTDIQPINLIPFKALISTLIAIAVNQHQTLHTGF